jgi:hypothetical protein
MYSNLRANSLDSEARFVHPIVCVQYAKFIGKAMQKAVHRGWSIETRASL